MMKMLCFLGMSLRACMYIRSIVGARLGEVSVLPSETLKVFCSPTLISAQLTRMGWACLSGGRMPSNSSQAPAVRRSIVVREMGEVAGVASYRDFLFLDYLYSPAMTLAPCP